MKYYFLCAILAAIILGVSGICEKIFGKQAYHYSYVFYQGQGDGCFESSHAVTQASVRLLEKSLAKDHNLADVVVQSWQPMAGNCDE